jgi:hypothetical protein
MLSKSLFQFLIVSFSFPLQSLHLGIQNQTAMSRPLADEYESYYQRYIDMVPGEDIIENLRELQESTKNFFTAIPPEKENYAYSEGKWTVKEVFGHIIDTERIFAYRALRFARNDASALPGFDQDTYVLNGGFQERTMFSLIEEYNCMRASNIVLYQSFPNEVLTRKGNANGKFVSVRAIMYMTAGHEIHHLNVLRERYLS